MTILPGFRPELLDFKRGIHVGNLEPHERITKILKGAPPSGIPVEGAKKVDLVLNIKAAGDLDLSGNYWGARPGATPRIRDYRERKESGKVALDRPLAVSPPGVTGEPTK